MSECTAVHAAAFRLPPFSTTDTLVWFRRAEIQFRLKKITVSYTKADYVLAALPDCVFTRLATWLNDQPDEISFEDLKKKLQQIYSPSTSERARRVLAMPGQALGDRTAQQVWDDITNLCRLPDVDPSTQLHKEIDLKKEIWLLSLPDHVRRIIDANLPVVDLIKRADELIEAHRTTATLPAVHATTPPDNGHDDIEVSAVSRGTTKFRRNNLASRRSFTTINESGLCGYHQRFGSNARSCADGCRWKSSKNC